MQFLNTFFYETGVPRAQNEKIKMCNAMRYYFTSPTDNKFEKSIIEYRCRTGACPDDWPGALQELIEKDRIKTEQWNDEQELAEKAKARRLEELEELRRLKINNENMKAARLFGG